MLDPVDRKVGQTGSADSPDLRQSSDDDGALVKFGFASPAEWWNSPAGQPRDFRSADLSRVD